MARPVTRRRASRFAEGAPSAWSPWRPVNTGHGRRAVRPHGVVSDPALRAYLTERERVVAWPGWRAAESRVRVGDAAEHFAV